MQSIKGFYRHWEFSKFLKMENHFYFLLEANPGPGLGILIAFMLFGKGSAKATAPGAILIQFVGGIHEIYFPYVMMKPALFLL